MEPPLETLSLVPLIMNGEGNAIENLSKPPLIFSHYIAFLLELLAVVLQLRLDAPGEVRIVVFSPKLLLCH